MCYWTCITHYLAQLSIIADELTAADGAVVLLESIKVSYEKCEAFAIIEKEQVRF